MFAVLAFLLAIVAANLSVAYFGPVATPVNAFLLIGLDLSLRDYLHDRWLGNNLALKMFGLICAGAVITYGLNRNAGMICVASVVAFASALVVDTLVYSRLHNKSRLYRMNGSNIASAATDSLLFPTIAFGAFLPWIVILQFIAKVGGGAIWAKILTHKNRINDRENCRR